MTDMRLCPHGFHHPEVERLEYPHSCDGCWCEGERDQQLYGWQHTTDPSLAEAVDISRSYVSRLWDEDWSSAQDEKYDQPQARRSVLGKRHD